MQKIKILLITAVAIIGALLIYNHFDKIRKNEIVIDKFSSEYNLVSQNNIFKYNSIDEILSIFESKTGVIFFCTKESNWCNHYASYINEVLMNKGIKEINYLDLKKDRELNTVKYQKILEYLSPYIYKDDTNNMKIYMPDLTFVKNGEIIAHDNETSLVASDIEDKSYWTEEKVRDFKNKISQYADMLNEE